MSKAILTRNVKRSIGKILPLLLLVLYIAGPSHLELLHSFVHDDDVAVTHSEEKEKDPCHRLVYHNDTAQGCVHDSHLIVSDKCQMCDLAHHGDQTALSNMGFVPGESPAQHFDFYKLNLDSYWAVISSSRAPPALV